MRKRLIAPETVGESPNDSQWLDLDDATAEISSEDPRHPVEAALSLGVVEGTGWRAGAPGRQTLRILFDEPQRIHRIHVEFTEREISRTQEFTIAWSADHGETFNQIVRQQWNFSPNGAPTEIEDYAVDLEAVTALELQIDPDRSRGGAHASLQRLRIA